MDDHYQYSRPQPKLICHSSVQLDQMLMLPSSADSDLDSVPPGSQLYQIKEKAYMQRLQVFQEAQQRQAQLVQKLQTKVRTSGLCQDVMKSCDLASLAVFCFFFRSSTRSCSTRRGVASWRNKSLGRPPRPRRCD